MVSVDLDKPIVKSSSYPRPHRGLWYGNGLTLIFMFIQRQHCTKQLDEEHMLLPNNFKSFQSFLKISEAKYSKIVKKYNDVNRLWMMILMQFFFLSNGSMGLRDLRMLSSKKLFKQIQQLSNGSDLLQNWRRLKIWDEFLW